MRNGAVALLWPSLPPSLPLSLPRMAVRGSDSDLSLPLSLPLLARCLRDTTVLISQHAEPSRHSTAAAAAVQQHQAVCVLAAAARARPSEFQLLEPPLTDELLVLSDASRGARRRGDLFRRGRRRDAAEYLETTSFAKINNCGAPKTRRRTREGGQRARVARAVTHLQRQILRFYSLQSNHSYHRTNCV